METQTLVIGIISSSNNHNIIICLITLVGGSYRTVRLAVTRDEKLWLFGILVVKRINFE
jgi:hypothetical protein